jgi:hypothetical protein
MPEISVRDGIPCPQTSSVTIEERRLLSEGTVGPRRERTIELDERQLQRMSWMLSKEQYAIFKEWRRDDLIDGGAWFAAPATWPAPDGLIVKVRRFIGGTQREYLGNGFWRISEVAEVRGETLLPGTPVIPTLQLLWLDLFNGTAGTALDDHAQDIPLEGSVWVPASMFINQPGVLDGSGRATASSEYSTNDITAITTFGSGPFVDFGYRFEVDVIPVISAGDEFEGDIGQTIIVFDTYEFSFELVFNPDSESEPAFVSLNATINVPLEEGLTTVAVVFDADGWTATVNGVAQPKQEQPLFNPPQLDRVVMTIGTAINGSFERVTPYARIERGAIYGSPSV